jgi:Domain of unknown function (DUF4384)
MKKMLVFSGLFCLAVAGSVIGQTRSSKPNVVVFVTTTPKDAVLESTLTGSFQDAIQRSGRFELLARGGDLAALLKEDNLRLSGVTINANQQSGLKKLGADQLLVIDASSQGLMLNGSRTVNVSTKLISVASSKSDPNAGDFFSIDKSRSSESGGRWLSTYLARAPLEGAITTLTPQARINLGSDQGLGRLFTQGRIIRRENVGTPSELDFVIGEFEIDPDSLGKVNCGITFSSNLKLTPRVGDIVQLGPLERQSQEARDLIAATSDQAASLTVRYADGTAINDFKVREGEKIQLEFGTTTMAGFPYVLSFFPNEQEFYLLYPYRSASKKLVLGRSQLFPTKNDPLELVAQKPYGKTLVKVLVTRDPIPAFENKLENRMGAVQAKSVNDFLERNRGKWASGVATFDITP